LIGYAPNIPLEEKKSSKEKKKHKNVRKNDVRVVVGYGFKIQV
jgi:hypothetical protein